VIIITLQPSTFFSIIYLDGSMEEKIDSDTRTGLKGYFHHNDDV